MYQKVVSTGFLLHKKKALIIQRSMEETFLPGYYELPGGKVDFGEDPRKALAREYREEVNLQVIVDTPFKVFSYLSDHGDRHTVEILFHVYLVDPKQDQVILSCAHTDFQWVTNDEIEGYPISSEIKNGILYGFEAIPK